jgi:regulator of sirC expression with transglutaminase-like and TPR domain
MLARATHKQIIMRMLQNLQRSYMQARDYDRAILTLGFLLDGMPDHPQLLKLRGALLLDRKQYAAAAADLEHYLQLQPTATEADVVREQIRSIRRWIAQRN